MAAPTFEFTDRAIPIVQIGPVARLAPATCGTPPLGGRPTGVAADWEPAIWTDLTCEIHEITTDTGRGGATDRFRPGTAEIVASNVNQVSEMIVPAGAGHGDRFEFVPQPPIDHEEDLQAPNAATVVSNGWSFTDDFETAPPRWVFPAACATSGALPTVPDVDGASNRRCTGTTPSTSTAPTGPPNGPAATTRPATPSRSTLTNLDWAADRTRPPGSSSSSIYGQHDEQGRGQVRFVSPCSAAPTRCSSTGSTCWPTAPGSGFDPHHPVTRPAPTATSSVRCRAPSGSARDGGGRVNVSRHSDVDGGFGWVAAGDRIGMSVHYVEGDCHRHDRGAPHHHGQRGGLHR